MGQKQKSRKAEKSPLNFQKHGKVENIVGEFNEKLILGCCVMTTFIHIQQRRLQVWSLDVFTNVHLVVNIGNH